MSYKVEKKADGWYVGGVRHASQNAATTALIALLSGKGSPAVGAGRAKASPKGGSGSSGREKVSSPLAGLTYLDSGEDIGDLVNGEVIEGWAAKVIGQVKAPPKGMGEFTHVVLVATAASRFDIILFDDEQVYIRRIYKGIPDRTLANKLAASAYAHYNHHAQRMDRALMDEAEKYAVRSR